MPLPTWAHFILSVTWEISFFPSLGTRLDKWTFSWGLGIALLAKRTWPLSGLIVLFPFRRDSSTISSVDGGTAYLGLRLNM